MRVILFLAMFVANSSFVAVGGDAATTLAHVQYETRYEQASGDDYECHELRSIIVSPQSDYDSCCRTSDDCNPGYSCYLPPDTDCGSCYNNWP